MTDDNCCEVPLVEKLRSVQKDYRTVVAIQWASDGTETGHQFIPVGYMMHEAAEEIERLRTALSEAVIAERKACWEAINKHITSGPLVSGNGTDQNAQRNGMVLACNIIYNMMSGEPK